MNLNHRALATCALALAVGLTACSSDAQEETSTPTGAAPVQEESGDATSEQTSTPAQEESAETTSAPTAEPEATTEQAGPDTLEVTIEGDQGILALQHSGSVPEGTAGPSGRKLITGPGGCFALTNEGPPQLLVFPADATFVLQEGKPSATVAGTEFTVGRQFTVDTIAVSKSEVTGIPDRCAQGSADTVLVIN